MAQMNAQLTKTPRALLLTPDEAILIGTLLGATMSGIIEDNPPGFPNWDTKDLVMYCRCRDLMEKLHKVTKGEVAK